MNKKGTSIIEGRNFLYAITGTLLISFIFITFFYDGSTRYNVNVPDNYRETFEEINSTYQPITQISRDMEERAKKTQSFSAVDAVITSGSALIDSIKLFFNSIPTMSKLITILAESIGIHPTIISMIFVLFMIFITTFIIGVIRGIKI